MQHSQGFYGGLYWTRTSDPIDVNDVLYQLSQQTKVGFLRSLSRCPSHSGEGGGAVVLGAVPAEIHLCELATMDYQLSQQTIVGFPGFLSRWPVTFGRGWGCGGLGAVPAGIHLCELATMDYQVSQQTSHRNLPIFVYLAQLASFAQYPPAGRCFRKRLPFGRRNI